MRNLLLVVLSVLLTFSCNKDICPEYNNEIFDNCNDDEVCIKDIEFLNIQCVDWYIDELIVITDDSTYQTYYSSDYFYGLDLNNCADYELPGIDFTDRTLIIINTSNMGDKKPSYQYKLVLDSTRKEVIIHLKIWQYNRFTVNHSKTHELSIPRLSNDYNYVLDITQYQCNEK